MSFRIKTILGIALIQAVLLLLLVASAVHFMREANEEEFIRRATTTAALFAATTKQSLLSTDLAALEGLIDEVLGNVGVVYARVRDQEGRVLAQGGDQQALAKPFEQHRQLDDAEDGLFATGVDIRVAGVRYGTVELALSVAPLMRALENAQRWTSGIALLQMLAAAAFSFALGTYLTRQLGELREGARRLAQGDYAHRAVIHGRDELAETAHAFNEMAGRLQRSHDALHDSAVRIQAVMDSVVDGIMTLNEAGVVESVNPAAENLFGAGAGELQGKSIAVLLADVAGNTLSISHTPLGRVSEALGRRRDNSEFPAEVCLSEMVVAGRRMLTVVVRDITDRKRVEKLKSEFVATVSHELRTPLTAIRGSLGLVLGGAVGDIAATARRLLDVAQNNTERLTLLVNDLLDIEKIEAGSMRFDLQPVELSAVVRGGVEQGQPMASHYGVTFVVEGDLPGIVVTVDTGRLLQVLANLLSNAAKFSPRGGVVRISLSQPDQQTVRLTVSDQGPGIPEGFRERLFQRFAQADSSDSRQKGGTGLGLCISKAIVEKLGGKIDVESTSGNGASFYVELPTADATHDGAQSQTKSPRSAVS